jgi:hypothetical protein
MKTTYSSPQALLNRHFKGTNRFTYSDDSYENKRFILNWIEGECFELVEKRYCNDIGYYDHELGNDLLINLIPFMKGL